MIGLITCGLPDTLNPIVIILGAEDSILGRHISSTILLIAILALWGMHNQVGKLGHI
jgi:hypothetical protein